jgi:hypothetical protein
MYRFLAEDATTLIEIFKKLETKGSKLDRVTHRHLL